MYFVLIEHIITRVSGTQLPPLYTRRYIIFTRIPRRYIFPFSFSLQRCTYFSPSVRVRQYVRIYNVFLFSFFCQPFILTPHHTSFYLLLLCTQFSDKLDSKFYSPRSTLELNNKGNTLRSEFVDATNRMERYLFLFFKNNEEWKWNKITVRTN